MKLPHFEAIRVCLRLRRVGDLAASSTRIILLITGILAVTACVAAADSHQSIAVRSLTVPQVVGGIATRSADLNYITEQDSEVFAFYRNAPVKELTDTVFLTLLRRPAETRIFQQAWSEFFRQRTSNDPGGGWRQLQLYLESNLTNLTVFRIPRDSPYGAQYDLYAVGLLNKTTVVGVQMFGVAT